MHELGNPMHSFDYNKLKENRIVVRRAKDDEIITTLDEVERKFDNSMLVICDAEKPLAVGGVMGGFDSGITAETTDVLLEVAYFDRDSIRQTSRKLKLSTEASHRFERGVDIENLIRASNRATALICELAGGEAGDFIDVYPTKNVSREIISNDIHFAVKRLTGLDVGETEILRILDNLGIKSISRNSQSIVFTAPTWRHDIAIEEDLVEEIARIVGYEKIGEELPPAFGAGEYQPSEPRKKELRQAMKNIGFDEAISYSFIDSKNDEKFELIPDLINLNLTEKYISLQDSIIEGAVRMRPSLLSGLLDAVRTNFNHQQRNLKLFELGKVFSAAGEENSLPNERELLALVMTGNEFYQDRARPVRELKFYDAEGGVENAVAALNAPDLEFTAKNIKHLRKGQSAEISINGSQIGSIGRLNDEIAGSYKFKQPVFVAEIDLQKLLAANEQNVSYHPLPVYPSIQRDVSLLIKRDLSFSEIKQTVTAESFALLQKIEFVDIYEGKGVADDSRSMTIRMEYRSNERTLQEDEVEAIHTKILTLLKEKLNAVSRF